MRKELYNAYHFMWAWLGARIHRKPSKRVFVIGVTGTKGKTTTLELLNAILEAAGKKTALLSSLRMKIGDSTQKNQTGNSMPGRGYIQKFLRRARADRCGYALIEVTSQGVVAHRHRFVNWNMGLLTNLAPEHIESHGSFENYRAAKLSFLKYVLKKKGQVFLNADDKHFSFFTEALAGTHEKVVEVTASEQWLRDRLAKSAPATSASPMRSVANAGGSDASVRNANVGNGRHDPAGAIAAARQKFFMSRFNEENIALAAAVAKTLGIADRVIEEAIENFAGVPGRMELVAAGDYLGIVDYAHTPDSLEAAYTAAQSLLPDNAARLICVLGGAGGGRDKWKRPEMGRIAAHYCDEIILTDEDPYNEDPQTIIEEIAGGIAQVPYPRPEVTKILDRREALGRAVGMMSEGDVVIATGKGSEDWIHLAHRKKIPWNEKALVQELLTEKIK